jgi:hypothetical protein
MQQLNYDSPAMTSHTRCRSILFSSIVVAAVVVSVAGCRRKEPQEPPVATPSLRLSHDKAPLGSPVDLTYSFVVAPDAHFDQDYRVMMHVVDADDELMWTDDHTPPTPTTQWKPGQTVEYTRTVFIPVYPYVGEATLQMGLYSTTTQKRLTLGGQDAGQRAYKVAKIQLQPQTENVFMVFKDGWNPTEVAEHNASIEWQWTKKEGTIAFKNPKKDCTFYLDVDQPGGNFTDTQHVTVTINGAMAEEFDLVPKNQQLHKIHLKADQLGSAEMAELHILVDKTFIPAQISGGTSKDPRELGIRVFHAFIEPVS